LEWKVPNSSYGLLFLTPLPLSVTNFIENRKKLIWSVRKTLTPSPLPKRYVISERPLAMELLSCIEMLRLLSLNAKDSSLTPKGSDPFIETPRVAAIVCMDLVQHCQFYLVCTFENNAEFTVITLDSFLFSDFLNFVNLQF